MRNYFRHSKHYYKCERCLYPFSHEIKFLLNITNYVQRIKGTDIIWLPIKQKTTQNICFKYYHLIRMLLKQNRYILVSPSVLF